MTVNIFKDLERLQAHKKWILIDGNIEIFIRLVWCFIVNTNPSARHLTDGQMTVRTAHFPLRKFSGQKFAVETHCFPDSNRQRLFPVGNRRKDI